MEARPRRQADGDEPSMEMISASSETDAKTRPIRLRRRMINTCWIVLDIIKRVVLMLPVLLVVGLVSVYWFTFVFVFQHARLDTQPVLAHAWSFLFSVLAGLTLASYFRCVLTSNAVGENTAPPHFDAEDCRRCDRCSSLKPDRTHHCSICGECCMKMDHHCPWVANCVGHYNYKFFFLFIMYACIGCNMYILGSFQGIMSMLSLGTRNPDLDSLMSSFMTLFAVISAFAFGLTLIGFVGFHLYLVLTNQTTLEYGYLGSNNPYNLGKRANFEAVFGKKKRYWFLPVNTLETTGYDFHTGSNGGLVDALDDEV